MNAAQPRLLIVEDDDAIRMQLKYALRDQYALTFAETRMKALALMNDVRPEIVSLDLGLPPHPDTAEEGLQALEDILKAAPTTKVIVVTGNGDRANARRAVELGAVDYLSKPVDADDVVAALLALEGRRAEPPENPMSADRVRWEHIQRIYELCGRNVSETARRLNMHRRTLQRILAKRAPK